MPRMGPEGSSQPAQLKDAGRGFATRPVCKVLEHVGSSPTSLTVSLPRESSCGLQIFSRNNPSLDSSISLPVFQDSHICIPSHNPPPELQEPFLIEGQSLLQRVTMTTVSKIQVYPLLRSAHPVVSSLGILQWGSPPPLSLPFSPCPPITKSSLPRTSRICAGLLFLFSVGS